MLITVCADKGSPGVTTVATALAASWFRAAILCEADTAGADLPYRLQGAKDAPLSLGSGLITLASDLRGTAPVDIMGHVQYAAGGLPVIVGPAGASQSASLNGMWKAIAETLAAHPDHDVIVDAGRMGSDNAAISPIIAASDLVLVVARNTAEGAAHLRHGLSSVLRIANANGIAASGRIGVVAQCEPMASTSVGPAMREMREFLDGTPGMKGIPVFAALPADVKAAAALRGLGSVKLAKTAYMRAIAGLVETLGKYSTRPAPTDMSAPVEGGHTQP